MQMVKLAAVSVAVFGWSNAVNAQQVQNVEAESVGGDVAQEIIVTAQKREQNVRDVPITMTALSGPAIKSSGLTTAMDLPDLVPGVRSTTPGGGAYTTTIIRGVGQQDIALHQEAPVATYVDGAYVSFTTAQTQPIFDVERVEVLKGPQGTLFGRNATGGLVHFVSRLPSQTLDGYATVEYGSYDKFMTEGAIGGSLGGDWSGRFSFHTESGGAYIHNSAGPDRNGNTVYAARAQILYKPSSDFSLLFSLYGNRFPTQAGPGPTGTRALPNPDGTAVPVTADNFAAYQAFCAAVIGTIPTELGSLGDCNIKLPDPFHVTMPGEAPTSGRYWNGTITLEAALSDDVDLISITNYQHTKQIFNVQIAPGFPTQIFTENNPSGEQFSQELRLSGSIGQLDWVVGGYGLYINNHTTAGINLFDVPNYGIALDADIRVKSTSVAGFAEATYYVTPRLTVIAGARLTRDHRHGVNTSSCTTNPAIPFDICGAIKASLPFEAVQFAGFDQSFSKTSVSARLVGQYKLTDEVNAYFGVNRGTKAGGFNTGANELYPTTVAQYGPETLTNYEGGIKARLFNGGMTLNAAGFYYDYKDLQTFSTKNSALYVFNLDAIVKGFELDTTIRPFNGLELTGSVSYLDTKTKKVPVGNGFRDYPIPGAPKFSADASATYQFDIGPGRLSTTVRYTHVDRRSTSAIDNRIENTPAYDKFDFRMAYDVGRVTAAFNIRNFTNETIFNAGVPFEALSGSVYNSVAPPRWYSASLTYRFD